MIFSVFVYFLKIVVVGAIKLYLCRMAYPSLIHAIFLKNLWDQFIHREHSGSVVECLTRDREAPCSSHTGLTELWPLSKTHLF